MEHVDVREDGKARCRRVMRSNPKFKQCIYFSLSPPNKHGNGAHTAGPCVITRIKVDYYVIPAQKDDLHIHNDVKDFLWDILENYDDTRNTHYRNLVSENEQMFLKQLHSDTSVRHFMLLHDFSPQQCQEEFQIVEYKHHVNELNNMNYTNYRTMAKVNKPIRYFEDFSHFVRNFPHSKEFESSKNQRSKRIRKRKNNTPAKKVKTFRQA